MPGPGYRPKPPNVKSSTVKGATGRVGALARKDPRRRCRTAKNSAEWVREALLASAPRNLRVSGPEETAACREASAYQRRTARSSRAKRRDLESDDVCESGKRSRSRVGPRCLARQPGDSNPRAWERVLSSRRQEAHENAARQSRARPPRSGWCRSRQEETKGTTGR